MNNGELNYFTWGVLPSSKLIRAAKGYMIVAARFPKNAPAWHKVLVYDLPVTAEWPSDLVLDGINSEALWDNMVVDSYHRIVSDRAARIFGDLGEKDLDFLPVLIKDPSGNIVTGFSLVRFRFPIRCIDLDKTMHRQNSLFPEEIEVPHWDIEVVLDRTLIGDRRIFRLANLPQTIVVRGDVVRAIEEAGLTGFDFSKRIKAQFPDEEYKPPKQFAALYAEWRAKRGKPVKTTAVSTETKLEKSANSKKSRNAAK